MRDSAAMLQDYGLPTPPPVKKRSVISGTQLRAGAVPVKAAPANLPPPPSPATTAELDESMKKLQRALTGSDDTGAFRRLDDGTALRLVR